MRKYKIWGIILLALAILATGGFLFRKQLAVLAFDMFLSDRVEKTLEQTYKPIIGKKKSSAKRILRSPCCCWASTNVTKRRAVRIH